MKRIVLVLVLALSAPAAFAQGVAGSVELTPTVGYWFGDTLARGSISNVDFDMTIDDAPSYGVRAAYRFTDNWAIEGFLTKSRADLVTGHKELFADRSTIGHIDLTTAELSMEVGFGHSRFVPFLAGGVGAQRLAPTLTITDPRFSNPSSDTRFVGNFGGGFKLFFTPQVALRFDWRGHSVNVGSRDRNCDWWNDCSHANDWLNYSEVALGLQFAF